MESNLDIWWKQRTHDSKPQNDPQTPSTMLQSWDTTFETGGGAPRGPFGFVCELYVSSRDGGGSASARRVEYCVHEATTWVATTSVFVVLASLPYRRIPGNLVLVLAGPFESVFGIQLLLRKQSIYLGDTEEILMA